ncbi:DEAD/DEAH box helicase [Brachymonas sp. G13]|uniref:DEAD/DEAH box helicase n=1 Tax=Brachymonas wangyanguii TaxID=3130163 RepID=UPI00307E4CB0
MTFEELNLAPELISAVRDLGYEQPSPIQVEAIPLVLAGHDLLGGAQTGTGKTAAFSLPMLQLLNAKPPARNGQVRALVLCPTRELAAQVEESVREYGKHLKLTSTVIFGGVGMNPQIQRLQKGVDILVATPGRLLDLQGQGAVDLSQVEILVLDEADRMLDMGFIHDVKKVLALLPRNKQSLLFSATFSDDIRELAQGLLRDPREVQVTPRNTTVQRITQVIHPVGRNKKKALLAHIIQQHDWSQVLVFTRTKFGANHVADYLNKNGISAMALHGNKSQSARTQALAGFKTGELRALVATDIAARGIDIDDLPHVVNYEIPNISEDYVHRIGRTGRAGASGTAVNFVCLDEEGFMHAIEKFTRQQIPVEFVEGFGPEEGEKAEPIAMGRQTLWGGAGKPPGRDVMAAAAKAARQEMMQRIRENKTARPAGGRSKPAADATQADGQIAGQQPPSSADNGDNAQRNRRRRNRFRSGGGGEQRQDSYGESAAQREPREPREPRQHKPRNPQQQPHGNAGGQNRSRRSPQRAGSEAQPRSHESQLFKGEFGVPRSQGNGGQPDPLRTSVDSLRRSNRNKRGGGGGFGW